MLLGLDAGEEIGEAAFGVLDIELIQNLSIRAFYCRTMNTGTDVDSDMTRWFA